MDLSRRKFIQGAAAAGAAGLGLGTAGDAAQDEHRSPQRKKRTIYFNDARHYYLFVFEPPMRLVDAWQPVDEVIFKVDYKDVSNGAETGVGEIHASAGYIF